MMSGASIVWSSLEGPGYTKTENIVDGELRMPYEGKRTSDTVVWQQSRTVLPSASILVGASLL